ncbi:MAG: protein kinase, partial [Acidobacteriaceae bacterium]|nr:protein kinase [Acidobacteriaceae bacterium]
YRVVDRLGHGGMGAVYKAYDCELDRVIALKIVRPDVASNPTAIRRLKQETLLARQIAHRNVVRVFDLGIAGGVRFITMEFVEGETLRVLLQRSRKLAPAEAIVILKQICEGLQAAHAEDVVHRDLKPANIIVGRDGRTRILDFGLARPAEETGITRTGVLLGTPDYMSPEQALGQTADARSDIFALGVMLYEMLSGRLPFASQTSIDSFLMRTRQGAPPLHSLEPGIPAKLEQITMRCLEIDPARRYKSAGEILDDLNAPEGATPEPRIAPGDALAPGTMLGSRYRIEAEAGSGGMGRVYRAMDLELNRTVALKVVREDLANNPEALERLKQEITLASRISHRNVLRIHDLGEANGIRFVSMAWADGEDLSELLRDAAPLPEARIFQLAIEICLGLEAAHEQGIVHRDLKPGNVLLDAAGHACIADFGLAHTADVPTTVSRSGEVHGTPRYMSPEQVESKATDARTDIYALGLILYEMATGRIPFRDDSVYQTMAQRVTDKPRDPKLLNPAISDALSRVILRCLEREPGERYQRAADLLEDLRRIAEPEKMVARSRPRRKSLYALAALLALAVATIVWLRQRSQILAPPENGRYIAVLPFHVVGADPNLKYEAEGIADAISQRLLSLSSVHPVSSRAIEQADLQQPEGEIARKLGANLILAGSVQSQLDRIGVIAHIDNTKTHKQVWSKSFSGLREDLFTLEDEICNEIVSALNVTPSLAERERAAIQPTQDINAYDLYLKGRDLLKTHKDAQDDNAALALFEEACAKDPSFALAWTGVADASLSLYNRKKESFWAEKALAAAREAKTKNDSLPEVHFALGSVDSATGRHAQAVQEIKRALQLEPNSDDGYLRLGRAYLRAGQSETALAAFQKAVDLNPYYWYNHDRLGTAYAELGRNDQALKELHRAVELNANAASAYNNIGVIYLHEGRWNDCIAMLRKVIELRPSANAYTNLGTAYFYQGRYADAVAMDEKAAQMSPGQQIILGNLADSYRQAGQWSKAQATYDRAIEQAYRQLEVNPRDADALGSLALYYARKGGTTQPPLLINQARTIDPGNDTLMYDEAVVDALGGRKEDALKALERALRNGFSVDVAQSEPDLKSIRSLPEFEELLARVKHRE